MADGFISPRKEVVLRIFIVLKNPSPSARFEPANLRSHGEHANYYTTEDDNYECYFTAYISRYRLLSKAITSFLRLCVNCINKISTNFWKNQ
jgi:hypothetical protein